MDGFNRTLAARSAGAPGLSKISVQSGTSHGGVVLPDGSIADVALDLDTLGELSKIARDEYGMAGAVQHGASTLPDGAFNNFPRTETAEIHLATNFQNMLFDPPAAPLRQEIYDGSRRTRRTSANRPTRTSSSSTRRGKRRSGRSSAPVDLPDDVKAAVAKAYDTKFEFLFTQLGDRQHRAAGSEHVKAVRLHRPMPGPPATRTSPPPRRHD
jgi:hypothetical protein